VAEAAAARVALRVVAAVLRAADGRVLVSKRPPHRPQAGYWEFPGGKLEPGEAARAGLQRELREELGIETQVCHELLTLEHDYPDQRVQLAVWCVDRYSGEVTAAEAQELRWVTLTELTQLPLLPADWPIIEKLRT
jgi:8-oxo-dGTP diphosphatase